jgi:hypothetical protein
MTRHEEIRQACQEFHDTHPEVWALFCQFALEKAALGYENFGVSGVFERVRWETSAGGEDPDLKINNNFKPFYARRFNRMHPELGGGEFFRVREQTTRHRAATGRAAFIAPRSEESPRV